MRINSEKPHKKMEYKLEDMCDWERKKAIFLMGEAEKLGYSLKDYGEVAVNTTSGYVYIWSENYNFSLYMPISCELVKTDIYALWTNLEDGEEIEMPLKEDTTLKDIEEWSESLEKGERATIEE